MHSETLMKKFEHEQVVYCGDPSTGLRAIIAIHDTTLGPALGGCRFWPYESEQDALLDVLRLSRGMTYKASVAGLSLGGGKSVILGDPAQLKNEQLLRHFGRFVHSLSGRYITAEDVNVRVADMNIVAEETEYVTGISSRPGGSGDPSPVTAFGVFHGIRASVVHRHRVDSLAGIHVAVKGCGAVGRALCQYLYEAGAQLTIADVRAENIDQTLEQVAATVVPPESIHTTVCDVLAPCALGGDLNDFTIPEIKAKIIAGAANNQLLDEAVHMQMLMDAGILYAPDYVINAGGLINVSHELRGYDAQAAKAEAAGIFDTMSQVFDAALAQGTSTLQASNRMAEERIAAARQQTAFMQHTYQNQSWIKASQEG
ncbi:MAG: leucine dehydrogenase [Zetaproteobacteria bacterium]|nr:leucine dehydrogenase [Zetaproteobacteria bacterium]